MRYLVTAKLNPGCEQLLQKAIEEETIGEGSVAYGEYLRVMRNARLLEDGNVKWVEVCYCRDPLNEERSYWEEFFQIVGIEDAHNRENCRDLDGTQDWACGDCDCTQELEAKMSDWGEPFLATLSGALKKGAN